MCAYSFEELEVVQELLVHGAVACINSGDISPLSYAAQKNHKVLEEGRKEGKQDLHDTLVF